MLTVLEHLFSCPSNSNEWIKQLQKHPACFCTRKTFFLKGHCWSPIPGISYSKLLCLFLLYCFTLEQVSISLNRSLLMEGSTRLSVINSLLHYWISCFLFSINFNSLNVFSLVRCILPYFFSNYAFNFILPYFFSNYT